MSTLDEHVCKPEARRFLTRTEPFGRTVWQMRCVERYQRAPKAQAIEIDFCPFCGKRLRDIVVSP